MRHFGFSIMVSLMLLAVAGGWGFHNAGLAGLVHALWITLILGVLEVSLSFDNAVVNASVLKHWSPFWQKLFLGLGILVAVFGMRLLFPLVIVSQATGLELMKVWNLALVDPHEYSRHLGASHAQVAAFGGMFLLLVFLNFFFNQEKKIHWFSPLEKHLPRIGKMGPVTIILALLSLLGTVSLVSQETQDCVLRSGVWGIVVYGTVRLLSDFLEGDESDGGAGHVLMRGSLGGFLYLEVLDASFSFDGVIGAFAITTDVVLVMMGLGIGAMFVRSLTVFLVHRKTLARYVYLEHGAHYAIGALAVIMLSSINVHVPEMVTGLIGLFLIGLSLISSFHARKVNGA
ncbi:MAG: DUF475 domain-containing protein [Magnetococcales bacterium]|nr:DUF475 domain-containing protein [Magnetococcales bacterium]